MQILHGWLDCARRVPSPNFNQRPVDTVVSLLVIHNISLPPGEFGGPHIEALFTNCLDPEGHDCFPELCGLEVSSHFLIRRNGELLQFVALDERAWHAGQSCFEGRENCNDFSVGIELEGCDDQPYSDQQYQALEQLTRCLLDYFPALAVDRIVGHSDIAPERKTDPGESFDWPRYLDSLSKEQSGV